MLDERTAATSSECQALDTTKQTSTAKQAVHCSARNHSRDKCLVVSNPGQVCVPALDDFLSASENLNTAIGEDSRATNIPTSQVGEADLGGERLCSEAVPECDDQNGSSSSLDLPRVIRDSRDVCEFIALGLVEELMDESDISTPAGRSSNFNRREYNRMIGRSMIHVE